MPARRPPRRITNDDLTWTWGDRIAKLRRVTGLNQTDIAALCHVDRTTVGAWEAGEHQPPKTKRTRYASAIAAGTGAPIDWLLDSDACP